MIQVKENKMLIATCFMTLHDDTFEMDNSLDLNDEKHISMKSYQYLKEFHEYMEKLSWETINLKRKPPCPLQQLVLKENPHKNNLH